MFFVFIEIIDTDSKEDIIMALRSVGIHKVTSLESTNLDKSLDTDITLFSGFFRSSRHDDQTVLVTMTEDLERITQFLETLRVAGFDIDSREILRVMAWPLAMAFESGQPSSK